MMAGQLVLEIACLLAILFVKESFCDSGLPDTAHCGQSFDNRIYGGSETHIAEHPWTVLISLQGSDGLSLPCGGTLINNRYVLTAQHCMFLDSLKDNKNDKPIRLGEWDRTTNPDCEKLKNGKTICADPHVDVGIEEWISHPDYVHSGKDPKNDIALIRLDRNVNFTNYIQPLCLPVQQSLRSKKKFVGKNMYIVGWGTTETAANSQIKRKAVVAGIDLDVCRQKYSIFGVDLKRSQMCTGGEVGLGQCSGDSGGPLISKEKIDNRNVYVLAGIISFSRKPCGSIQPAVHTRVSSYIDWILDNLKSKDRKRKNENENENEKKANKRKKKDR